MDKFEYKVRADEILQLIGTGEYEEAAEIADTIDWRRVKSVTMLCTISDLYKANKRYEDAKNVLFLAYERRPGGRTICYSLCELCIKIGEFVQAMNYYKEFVEVAPKDSGKFVLQYKLLEAQDVNLEERIEVLEALKKADYREKWAYELAYLYHKVGRATCCVEECDELILWFGDGKYVYKAMELKMQHQALTPEQQEKYDRRQEKEEASAKQAADAEKNLISKGETLVEDAQSRTEEETDIRVKPVDVGQFNTINLQAELAAGLQEILRTDAITQAILEPMHERAAEEEAESTGKEEVPVASVTEKQANPESAEVEETEVFFGETGEISHVQALFGDTADFTEITLGSLDEEETVEESIPEPVVEEDSVETEVPTEIVDETAKTVMEQMRLESAGILANPAFTSQPPKALESVLSQDSDGQLRLVVPERDAVEKQITGQLKIDDILLEWERMKQEREEKCKEEVRRHVKEQTGTMFTEFEAAIRDGLLEKLEKGEQVDLDTLQVVESVETSEQEEVEEIAEDSETCEAETDEVEELEEVEETVEASETDEVAEEDDVPENCEDESSAQEPENIYEPKEERPRVRPLTREERELYAPFIQTRSAKERLVTAIDNISMAAYTGNLVITGEEGMDTMSLAKNIVREIQMTDSNFSGKVAKVSGEGLNQRNVTETITQLSNGALIVQKASGMDEQTVYDMSKALQQENFGIVVVLEDTKRAINNLFAAYPKLADCFTARMDVEALSNDSLVAFGRAYAHEMEFSIDELGVLALHTRIDEMQTSDHVVTVLDVKKIMDEAMRHASRKTLKHFLDVLFGKRYDDEDMIILTEKDFV